MNDSKAFAAILAGGSGTRMGNPDKPKQFLMLGSKPIIVHTIEKFCVSGRFTAVVALCPQAWIHQTQDLLKRFCPQFAESVIVTAGGATRNDTVRNAVSYIRNYFETDAETVLVTHDAVRPFVSYRIIDDNIRLAQEVGACDTVVPATDTIVESLNGTDISNIPSRNTLYQGQTPQSFKLHELERLMNSLTPEEEQTLTDACKIFVLRGEKVALAQGDVSNMKITYPQDLRVATALIEG